MRQALKLGDPVDKRQLDGGDAREGQEEAEMVGEVSIGAGHGFAGGQVFGLKLRFGTLTRRSVHPASPI